MLRRVLPDAEVKMDAGHVLFSRLGKLLDQLHALYGEWPSNMQYCNSNLVPKPCRSLHDSQQQYSQHDLLSAALLDGCNVVDCAPPSLTQGCVVLPTLQVRHPRA
jgi:hypothetical protein